MNITTLTRLGGLPSTQYTLDFQQQTMLAAFMAIASVLGDKVILMGMDIPVGSSQITNGWASVNGELIEFVGGVVLPTLGIVTTDQTRVFDDGQSKQVYQTRQLKCVAGGQYLLADFVNLKSDSVALASSTVIASSQAVKTVNDALIVAQNDIATLKAVIASLGYLGSGTIAFGDVTADTRILVTHNLNISGNYVVLGELLGLSTAGSDDNDVTWSTSKHTANTFELWFHETYSAVQNLSFPYKIFKL